MIKILILFVFFTLLGCVSSQTLRQDYINNHPNLSERDKQAILNETIYVGMPANSVIASWGRPFEVVQSYGEFGNYETWYYKYYYKYWRTSSIVTLRKDDDGIQRVIDIVKFN